MDYASLISQHIYDLNHILNLLDHGWALFQRLLLSVHMLVQHTVSRTHAAPCQYESPAQVGVHLCHFPLLAAVQLSVVFNVEITSQDDAYLPICTAREFLDHFVTLLQSGSQADCQSRRVQLVALVSGCTRSCGRSRLRYPDSCCNRESGQTHVVGRCF